MKKYVFVILLVCLTGRLFADVQKEIENFVKKDVNSKEFQQADESIKSLEKQGSKLSRQGKYEKALECYRKALAQADSLYGKESTASALIYTCMGSLFLKKGDKLKAADSLVKSSEIYKKSLGGMLCPKTGRRLLIYAGFFYFESQYYRMAYRTLEQAQSDIKSLSAEEKEEYLPKFNEYLGIAYLREGLPEKAIPYLQKSLKYETADDDRLALCNLLLGEAFLENGEFKEALKSLMESKKVSNSIKTSTAQQFLLYSCLARTFKYLKQPQKYYEFAEKASKTAEFFDKSDGRKIIGIISYADASYNIGKITQAQNELTRARLLAKGESFPDRLGVRIINLNSFWQVKAKSSDKAEIAYWKGRVFFDEEMLDDAFASLRQALKYEKRKIKKNYQLLSKINFWLGEISFQFGEWKKSVEFLEEALLCTNKYNFDSDFHSKLTETLSIAYLKDKNYKVGLKYALEAYNDYKNKYGDKTIKAGIHLSGIGVLYDKLGQKDKAIASFEKALTILQKYRYKNPYPFNQAQKYLEKLR
ncbi:MAG: tetratricopeptide repeat protein [Victivallaceae bacterium]